MNRQKLASDYARYLLGTCIAGSEALSSAAVWLDAGLRSAKEAPGCHHNLVLRRLPVPPVMLVPTFFLPSSAPNTSARPWSVTTQTASLSPHPRKCFIN